MDLLAFLRRKKSDIPPAISKLLDRTDDPAKLLEGIDRLLTENQVRLEKVRRESFQLEGTRNAEAAKIEGGELSERMEAMILDQIDRLETRLDALEGEMRILTRNVHALTSIEGKIREARAMALKGFSEEQIEEILLDHGERKDAYLQAVSATDLDAEYDALEAEQATRREQLKARILARKEARRTRDEEPLAPLVSEEPLTPGPTKDDDAEEDEGDLVFE